VFEVNKVFSPWVILLGEVPPISGGGGPPCSFGRMADGSSTRE
jgi:hypothetical protein